MKKQSKINKEDYEIIELKISEKDADNIKLLESGAHLHFQINNNKEIIIEKI
jgi:hypothetical protein